MTGCKLPDGSTIGVSGNFFSPFSFISKLLQDGKEKDLRLILNVLFQLIY